MEYGFFLVKLINMALYNKEMKISFSELENIDWNIIKNEAKNHNCMSIIFPAVKKLQCEYNVIPKDLFEEWEEDVIVLGAAQCIQNYELNDVLSNLKNNGIKSAIFKGAVLADLYPEYLLRISGDADILIDSSDNENAIKVIKDMGYSVDEAASKENVTVLYKGNILVIELHTSLWEDYKGEKIDRIKKLNIDDKSQYIDFNGCDIKGNTLGFTKHFEYIFYHMVKHFIPGGIGLRHLIDITLYYNRYKNKIDMEKFSEDMLMLEYDKFSKAIFYICVNLLGMDRSVISKDYTLDSRLFDKLVYDIFDAGVFGNRTIERVKSRNVIKQTYYEKEGSSDIKKFKIIINTLFPSPDMLSDRYVNAKKYKILLPVAWTQRAIHHLKSKMVNSSEPDIIMKTKAVNDRIIFLKELGL